MAVTIKDVAKKAGVSSATVSRVLSNQENVREEVRIRVRQAVEDLRYQPSHVARSFRTNRSRIIGLIVSDIVNPFYTSLVRSIEDAASKNGFAVFLCNTDEDLQKEEIYVDFMIGERVAGVLLSPVCEEKSSVKKLLDTGIPVVCMDRKVKGIETDTVMVDNVSGTYGAVEHLLKLGHHRIGAMVGSRTTTGREREEGYRKALADYSIPIDESLLQRGSPKESVGREMTKQLLSLADRPTALFCGNNLLTVGALGEIFSQGLKVPGDIAIAGFDDLEWYSLVEPTITAVRQPIHEYGQSAINLLFSRIDGLSTPKQSIVLSTELFVRCSSGEVLHGKE